MKFLNSKINRQIVALLFVMSIVVSNLSLQLLLVDRAAAGTISQRKITLGTSQVSTSGTYSVSFIPASTTSIKGIVVDFCTTSPLIGSACSGANHPVTSVPTGGTFSVTQTSGFGSVNFTAQNPFVNSGKVLQLTSAAGTGGSTDNVHAVTFSFTATNPSATGTFYARIITYSTTADTTSYDPTTAGSATNPGSNVIDSGGIALSTANQLTTSAKVQESLQFCVGTSSVDDSTTTIANDCSGSFLNNCGTAVNLGVLDPSVTSVSPVTTSAGTPGLGNDCNGIAMVRTNASNGVIVTYFANQDTSSGKLKVIGATCSGGTSVTDQCFNDSTTQAAFTAGVEKFGVTVGGTNCNGTTTVSYSCDMSSGTNQLKATSGYIGNTLTAYGTNNGFAWDDTGTTEQLASSTGPVEDESLVLKFAATPAITTPSGTYAVTSTYVATATF